jgi:nicotinamidase/pyrazinamidase
VQGTPGAELHPALDRAAIDAVVDKGQDPGTEGYSGFEATGLAELLREEGVTAVTVVGIATDHCVRATALDAVRLGFATTVRLDLTAGVAPATVERALTEMRDAGVDLVGAPIVRP